MDGHISIRVTLHLYDRESGCEIAVRLRFSLPLDEGDSA